MSWLPRLLVVVLLPAAVVGGIRASTSAASGEEPPVDFLREVKPVLAEKCLTCHGPDEPEADLRLDTADGAFADLGGYAAVVPGDRAASELWYRISTDDARERMPPAEHGKPLTEAEVATLGRWIDEGAPWQEHWGFAPWREVQPPVVSAAAWPQDPLDHFVLARLEAAGLAPAPAASDLVWLRRVSFDLSGLPPTEAEVQAFLALPPDTRRDQTVDRLLASPHFGEAWARHLLDLVRYAETRGHEFDYPIPNAWEYRDYLVRALNADVGWDQLVREHLAGDLLDPPRRHPETGWNESIIGTGFWWLGEAVHSPVDLEVDLADRTANQLDVFGKAFLGLTIACARCHDHKFDPIPTRDYYALAGFVQSASYRQARFESLEANAAVRARVDVLDAAAREAGIPHAALERQLAAMRAAQALQEAAPALAEAIEAARATRVLADFEAGIPEGWTVEGAAFADAAWTRAGRPARYPDPQPVGAGFLNSHLPTADGAGADAATGRALSPPFLIDRDVLSFRVGGGQNLDEVGVRLLIEGEVVLRAAGRNGATLVPVSWDLRRWRGKEAQLEILDQATGSWGHVSCDDFRLQNRVDEAALAAQQDPEQAAALLSWAQDPLALDQDDWAALAPPPPTELPIENDRQPLWLPGDPWWQDGSAWSLQPAGPVLSADAAGLVAWQPVAALRSDPDWHELRRAPQSTDEVTQANWHGSGRSVRTSTMRLGAGPVWYLLRGKGVAFAPVEHHRILNGPLHTGTALRFDTAGNWRWVRHDLMQRYSGLRAHFEFSPTDGWIAVAAVVQGGEEAPPLPSASRALTELLQQRAHLPRVSPAAAKEAVYYTQRRALLAERRLESRMAPALLDGNGVDQPLLFRGDPASPREPVPRAMLTRFRAAEDRIPARDPAGLPTSGRLTLAEQMLERAGPLLARVLVNRLWHHLLGRGLAPQPDNFGVLAGYPTHPDLLDALAGDLRAGGWRLKPLIRRIVLSASYGQSGAADPAAAAADPENRLWHHRPPRRLPAEAVRDALLTVSGELNRTLGGPSVPVHLTSFMKGRGRPGQSGPLDGAGRRTLYQEIRRNFLPPFLMTWDYPPPATTMGRRSRSNVPAQALALMNDPFVREQADRWAARLAEQPAPIERIWWAAFGRPPRAEEARAAAAFLAEDGGSLAALCHAVVNLKEFVFLP